MSSARFYRLCHLAVTCCARVSTPSLERLQRPERTYSGRWFPSLDLIRPRFHVPMYVPEALLLWLHAALRPAVASVSRFSAPGFKALSRHIKAVVISSTQCIVPYI